MGRWIGGVSISDNDMVYFFVPIGFSSFCTIDMKDTTLDFPNPLYVRELGKNIIFWVLSCYTAINWKKLVTDKMLSTRINTMTVVEFYIVSGEIQ